MIQISPLRILLDPSFVLVITSYLVMFAFCLQMIARYHASSSLEISPKSSLGSFSSHSGGLSG
jgi:hypothetical protein